MAGLEDLYREIILDHYRSPRNRGELPVPPAHRVEGFNPLCGDEIVVYLEVEDGVVTDMRISGQGCSISQSSASMMSATVKGKPVEEARDAHPLFQGHDVDPRALPRRRRVRGRRGGRDDRAPTTWASWPPSRAWSSSPSGSSAPPCRGTPSPKGSTR